MAPIFTGGRMGFGRVDADSSGPSSVSVNIYLWGGLGTPGRSGSPEGGGWTQITGTATRGTQIGYIVGFRETSGGGGNFFYGGPGFSPANSINYGGGFSAAFVGPVNSGNATTYMLGVAGGAGGGGNDGFGDARGGAGGGTTGNGGREVPNQGGLAGGGATQSAGGSAGQGGGSSGSLWTGGSSGPPLQNVGGGGGGYYGGGGGGSNGGYDAGGGGGSGYARPASTVTNGADSFTVISSTTNTGTTSGHTVPAPVAALYPSPTSTNDTGKVVIEVNNVAVVNSTSAPPGNAVVLYTI